MDMEETTSRHKKEKKELQAKITALKKNSGKKDKKAVLEQIAQLENELSERQLSELANLSLNKTDDEEINVNIEEKEVNEDTPAVSKISKAQKRREKKEIDAKRREEDILLGEEENKNSNRNLEAKALNSILKKKNLSLHSITSDGDCLFNAIKHQLKLNEIIFEVHELRKLAADYIRSNSQELSCYMTSSKTNDQMTSEEFEEYVYQLEKTKAWGSQIEIVALSNTLKVKIEVLQATGTPIIQGEHEFKNKPHLIITYHRFFYGLGEHYNSSKPFEESDTEDQ